jgi:hypothetical protein
MYVDNTIGDATRQLRNVEPPEAIQSDQTT